ncbi:hypothetical protein [Ornithinibacillus californiensis]|uniref:hypothetical protein n=1 Tax=Ornithinibacillus californiensis TaxID=161536 RepID=UPI00064DF8FD|nr:hypothetical protein [Ornithinibacillus californiensis]
MSKKIVIVSFMISMFIIFTGCSNEENTIEKAVEELDYNALVPSYVPTGLELNDAVLEGELFIQSYSNEDESVFLEISQNQEAKGLNINRLLEFVET